MQLEEGGVADALHHGLAGLFLAKSRHGKDQNQNCRKK
jgi:hypothetical protein